MMKVTLILTIFYILIDMMVSKEVNTLIEAVSTIQSQENRSFTIDYTTDQFLKDGKPFQFVAGSFHYFRALPETWQRKLRTMRTAGINVLTTYVEWSLHNPKEGVYKWDGMADFEEFIRLAVAEDLLVILRPGPYICAERDMGGFPYWLLHKYPDIKLRTTDKDFLYEVGVWYDILMPKMEPYLYANGGPIIMVQVENEYGSFDCNSTYRQAMHAVTEKYVGSKAVLFTNDGPIQLKCGKIDGVYASIDFGSISQHDVENAWKQLRKYQPNGPLFNSEYYPGWLTHWGEPSMARVDTKQVIDTFKIMMNQNASVNIYMFYGGTNFGYTAGANMDGTVFHADITSYDYDAPMDEAGDVTDKYLAIREAIGQYLPLPNRDVPAKEPKMNYGPLFLRPIDSILSPHGRQFLTLGSPVHEKHPITFEALNQYSGYVLYETILNDNYDKKALVIGDVRDRAHVFVDRVLVGILSRQFKINSTKITAKSGQKLQILVENQGRINYGIANDFKGILSPVILDGTPLEDWIISGFPFDDYQPIKQFVRNSGEHTLSTVNKTDLSNGPIVFYGEFELVSNEPIYDTYFDPTGWGKGILFVNEFNVGRYWPTVGPQITVYIPKELLHVGNNTIVMIESDQAPDNGIVIMKDSPIIK